MKKVVFLIALIVSLIIINLVTLQRKKQDEKKLLITIQELDNSLKNKELDSFIWKESILTQQMSENILCDTIQLKDTQTNRSVLLSSLIHENKPCLFFRVKETHCDACVQSTTRLLTEISGHFPEKGIFILGGYKNVRQFNAFAQTFDAAFNVINVNSLPFAAENQQQPYFFILTSELKTQNVFIVNKNDPDFTSDYLHAMKDKYWGDTY